MEVQISRSKYVAETITIPVDFLGVLNSIVGSPSISVGVFSGTDPNPSNLLYLGSSIHQNTIVWQRFRLGLPGVVYNITYTVSDGTNTFSKEVYLAILPDEGNAVPNYFPYYLTSDLYPLEAQDQFRSFFLPQNGIFYVGQTWQQENFSSSFSPKEGIFQQAQVFYAIPAVDFFEPSFTPLNGYLTGALVTYTSTPETFSTDFAPLAGIFVEAQVFYTSPAETFSSSFVPLDGTLS